MTVQEEAYYEVFATLIDSQRISLPECGELADVILSNLVKRGCVIRVENGEDLEGCCIARLEPLIGGVMRVLSEEEIAQLNDQWEEEYYDVEMTDAEWEITRYGLIAKAQLRADVKAFVEWLEERGEAQHENCDESCAHKGMEVFIDKYDWQSLKELVEGK